MKRIVWNTVFLILALLAWLPAWGAAPEEHQHHVQGSQSVSANPLINEMTTLNTAYRDIVSAVALDDNAGVRKSIETMHGSMERSHAGMNSGTVTLPKNAARIKEFIERDRKFHDRLEALDRAARHDNKRELLRITKQLLDGCVQCHQTFRK